jgi:ATP-binding cassette, subfamily C, bacterial LapB
MDDVTVFRGNPDIPVLDKVNLKIGAGEIVAITGQSGGGKSAMLELLAGFLRPSAGTFLYDGTDTEHIDFFALRKKIAFVRQFAVMFQGTLLDNMTLFQGADRVSSALDVAHDLGLDETIAKMPKGMMTRTGDTSSEGLAGSVQQVLALVRVMAKGPQMLLFDEANSALDFDADQKLQKFIEDHRGQMTMVMVTDRPSMIAQADRVLSINGGEVAELRVPDTVPGGAE